MTHPGCAAAEGAEVSLDSIFSSQVGGLDWFYDLDSSYMYHKVTQYLFDLYLPYDNDGWTEYRIDGEIFEKWLYTYFEVSESELAAVRINGEYDEETETYMLYFQGGMGGSLNDREYQGFTDNGDGTYSVYYATVNYEFLPETDEIYDDLDEQGWPWQYEYEGKIYESGPDGYYRIDAVAKSGRVYGVEYNESNGYVRFLSQDNYTEEDLPESFDEKYVPAVTYYNIRHDSMLKLYDDGNFAPGTRITVNKLSSDWIYEAIEEKMADVAEKFISFRVYAKNSNWGDVPPAKPLKMTFDIPEDYNNPTVYYMNSSLELFELDAVIDTESSIAEFYADDVYAFILADKKTAVGDVNGDNVLNQYDYILIKRACMDTYNLTDSEKSAADINSNGIIDAYDYILVKRACMGTFEIAGF